jgi:formylglycine-generating enzyme required for sulfatase activity
MTKRFLRTAISGGLVLILGLFLGGCPQPTDDDSSGGPAEFSAVPVLTLAAGDTAGTLVYSWTGPEPAADSYDLYYAGEFLTDPAQIKTAGTKIEGAASGETISGLTAGVTYSAVLTASKDGYEAAESEIRYRTLLLPDSNTAGYAEFTAAPIVALTAGAEQGSLDYTWTDSDPEAERYTLYYAEGSDLTAEQVKAGTELPWVESGGSISGLKADTVYSVLVSARTSNYHPADSEIATGTPASIPRPVLTITPGTASNQLTFNWTAVDGATKYYLHYRAGTWGTAAEVKAEEGTQQDCRTSLTYKNMTLAYGTVYSCLIRAVTANGEVESLVVQATILPNPAVLSLSGVDANSITYTWTASDPAAESYDLYYVSGTETDPAVIKGGAKIAGAASGSPLNSLSANGTYSFLLAANIPGFEPVESAVKWEIAAAPGAQRIKTFSGVTLNFRYIPGGSFRYSSSSGSVATITSGYWLGETEVTQELFDAVMGAGHTNGFGDSPEGTEVQGKRPVETVNAYMAIAFCNKLSLLDGKDPAYSVAGITDWGSFAYIDIPKETNHTWNAVTLDTSKSGYRLPSYLEWMWAAMGADKTGQPNTTGQAKAFAGNSIGVNDSAGGDYAWYKDNAGSKTRQAAQKTANELGLYDMSGNVAELCNGGTTSGAVTDYTGTSSSNWVSMGGYWNTASTALTLRTTVAQTKSGTANTAGFRVFSPLP